MSELKLRPPLGTKADECGSEFISWRTASKGGPYKQNHAQWLRGVRGFLGFAEFADHADEGLNTAR